MKINMIRDEDFTNYKKPSMFISFPYCTFKCEKDCGIKCCQNSELAKSPIINYDINKLIKRYIDNIYTSAIVCGGLEPFDSFEELIIFIMKFREVSKDDIVIYTGYNEYEIQNKIDKLKQYENIIVKFGRFVPDNEKHYDEVLGIYLASDNQYGKKIS